jgi:RHS repeat-associated protein
MLADHQGSIRQIVDNGGALLNQITYDSYGNITHQTNPSVTFRFGYTGREWDGETGQYYYRARYYDARVGRFLSTDPIGFTAGDANLYRYVGNSPTNFTDPSGLLSSAQQAALLSIAVYGVKEFNYPRPAHAPRTLCDIAPDKFAAERDAHDKLSSLFPIGMVFTGSGRLGGFGDDLARGADAADDLGRAGSRAFNPEPPSTRNILPPASPPGQKALPPGNSGNLPFGNIPRGDFNPSRVDLGALRNAANQPLGKGGLTRVGHALDKHAAGQRGASPFPRLSGSNQNKNVVAQQQLDEILSSSDATFKKLGRGGVEVRLPDRRGVRFNADGSFSSFVD